MYAFEPGTVLTRPALDLPVAEAEPRVGEPVCDGCGRPSPCPAATHVHRRELAADFARGYSGL
ncbi:hypothetical protein [Catellatospora citrea]|uniref:Uncharacterized protein n=1 Tax=Catellatospora citrea TaxID=53366 RepID=A0A8J3KJE1_9ACTN|nr:hypothetical protein [Catellatospora citrea]RKE00425.1 hypothetical protein C8E86_8298 [Catellatospora citrea]GIF98085.1 hypothetical protein Cci01nite_31790 [Catellatospora citrea]